VTRAAEIIAALLAGKPAPVVERHTGMPYGWGLWLRALKERLGIIPRDTADSIVAQFAQRPVPPVPARSPALNRWQAMRSLFYQDWDPPLREERGLRWTAGAITLLMHLLFALLLVMLAVVGLPPPPPPASDSSRVAVEFIGEGTPEKSGGGPPAEQAESSQAAASAATQPAQVESSSTPSAAAEASEAVPPDITEPAPVVAQQNVQVTETPAPTTDFVLPPVTARTPQIAPPQIKPRELSVPTREVPVVQVPQPPRELPQREIAVPQVAQTVPVIRQREIAVPVSPIRTVQLPTRTVAAPELRAPSVNVRQAEIPLPSRGTASSSSNANATSPASTGSSTQSTTTPQGTQPGATASGSATANRPGAAPAPQRGDDWGASTRNVPGSAGVSPGSSAGLFNADGSARVPDSGTGTANKPGAPGSRQQQQADADRASKWLERPEYPYEPTMFDKYWVPNESLLAEWVRRAIREVEVPIPGTSKKVKCVISVLQAGGACALNDPNINAQPSSGKPPPDIPVKRKPIPVDS
jgi:hypothetical protein